MTPARLIATFVLAMALALAVVQQSALLRQTGYRLSELRAQIAGEQAELAVHRSHLSKLRNPQRIQALVSWLGLDLREPPVAAALAEAPAPPPAAAREGTGPTERRTSETSIAALTTY